jgi:hypothetical protein
MAVWSALRTNQELVVNYSDQHSSEGLHPTLARQ